MGYRRLPLSDEQRIRALNRAKGKVDSSPDAGFILMPKTITRLNTTQPIFANNMTKRGSALKEQATATLLARKAKEKLRILVSHFIQVFNKGVERGVFQQSHRAFYQLDINSNKVPLLRTENEILRWGKHIIDGDASRVAGGGAPMAMPYTSEVTNAYNDFNTKRSDKSLKKDAYDNAQEDVSDMRKQVDKLILRVWDEVETAFNEEEPSSKRRKAREWGVLYVRRKGEKVEEKE